MRLDSKHIFYRESFDTSDIYDFSHSTRGCAVLIMNYEFANSDGNLPGVRHDINNMSNLFNSLGFDVEPLINRTKEKLFQDLKGK